MIVWLGIILSWMLCSLEHHLTVAWRPVLPSERSTATCSFISPLVTHFCLQRFDDLLFILSILKFHDGILGVRVFWFVVLSAGFAPLIKYLSLSAWECSLCLFLTPSIFFFPIFSF